MTVMVRNGSSNWFVDFTYRGVTKRNSSGVPVVQQGKTRAQTKREAQAVEDAWKREIDDLVTTGRTKTTLAQALDRYFKTVILQGRTDGVDFQKKAKRIMDGLGADTTLDALTETVIGTWADGLLASGKMELGEGKVWKPTDAGLKARSVNCYLGILRSVLKKAATKKWNHLAAAPTVELYKIDDKKLRYLTIEEAGALLRAAVPNKYDVTQSRHLQQLVCFLLGTGGRKTESLELCWENVNVDRTPASVTFADYTTKSGKSRTVPIHDTLRAMLIEMKAAQQRAGYTGNRVFVYKSQVDGSWIELQSVTKAFIRARRDAGLGPDVTLHTLRHTFASWLVQADVGLAKVQELLGHANIETTMIYAHLAPQHLEAAVARLGNQLAALSVEPAPLALAA